jgi:hypothetical protein
MVADCVEVTLLVDTVNVAVVAFAATVTFAGTCAATLLLVSDTTAPPAAAGELKVTVPVEEIPPTTEVGFRETEETPAGVTDNPAVWLDPLKAAVNVTEVVTPTAVVVAVKVALLEFAGIVTLAGTWPAGLLLNRETV